MPTAPNNSPGTSPNGESIAALVIHYGDPELTKQCLESLEGFDQIVVVDHPPTRIGELPSNITRVAPEQNLGFAGGCNIGVEAVQTPFVFVINNDATLAPGALSTLRKTIAGLPDDVAATCPTIVDSRDNRIQSRGGLVFSIDAIGVPRCQGVAQSDDCAVPIEVAAPSGAAFLFRKQAWDDVGGMAAEFFCYCEDGDLGLRWQAAGKRVLSTPEIVVHHAYSSGTSVYSLHKAYLVERNHLLTAVHSAPLGFLLTLPFRAALRLGAMALEAMRGDGSAGQMAEQAGPAALVGTVLRAWRDALRMIGPALERRRQTSASAPADAGSRRVGNVLKEHRATFSQLLARRD